MTDYTEFPSSTIKQRAWHVYPRKGIVSVDGFKIFSLKSLKKITLNTRLSFPPELFTAIDKSK